jgi:DNA polymerase III delta prime subunit
MDESVGRGRFNSFKDLEQENDRLLAQWRQADRRPPIELRQDIRQFVRWAHRTGAVLETVADRWQAQSFLNHWAAVLHRAYLDELAASGTPSPSSGEERDAIPEEELTLLPLEPGLLVRDLSESDYPYPGLRPYAESDGDRFFGRETIVSRLETELRNNSGPAVLLLSGEPGSGKTSLIQAGLIPALIQQNTHRECIIGPFAPGRNPFLALAQALLDSRTNNDSDSGGTAPSVSKEELAAQIPRALAQYLPASKPPGQIFILVDSAEDLYLRNKEKMRQEFLTTLCSVAGEARILFATATACGLLLAGELPIPSKTIDLLPPIPQELMAAIENPARNKGLRIPEEVTAGLIRDVINEPAAFSLLAFGLRRLWEEGLESNRISVAAYERLRPLARNLVTVANQALTEIADATDRRAADRLLRRLAEGPSESWREFRDDTRFYALLRSELTVQADNDMHSKPPLLTKDILSQVADSLHQKGLLRLTAGANKDEDRFVLCHRALNRGWPYLERLAQEAQLESELAIMQVELKLQRIMNWGSLIGVLLLVLGYASWSIPDNTFSTRLGIISIISGIFVLLLYAACSIVNYVVLFFRRIGREKKTREALNVLRRQIAEETLQSKKTEKDSNLTEKSSDDNLTEKMPEGIVNKSRLIEVLDSYSKNIDGSMWQRLLPLLVKVLTQIQKK